MVVSTKYNNYIASKIRVAQGLISLLPKDLQKQYNFVGVSADTLAEIVVAYAKKTVCENGLGCDNKDGSETKYATIRSRKKKNSIVHEADINNLNTKTGDLHVIVADPDGIVSSKLFRFFYFPYNIWRNKIPGNKCTFSFKSDSYKWYMKYEVSQKEFFGK